MSEHNQTLFNQFQTNLNAHPKLSRQMVLDTFQQTVDAYFQKLAETNTQPTSTTGKTSKTRKTNRTTSIHPPNSQWPKILSSKDYGLTKFFTNDFETMKSENAKLNYFTAIKTLRDQHEGTDRWTEYLTWVRENNENAPVDDPPARGTKSENASNSAPLQENA